MSKPVASTSVPGSGEGKRGQEGYLGYLLRQAAAAYRNGVERSLADLEVTPPQFSVLTMLNAYPGLSGADLARLALLTPQTVHVIVANLERSGAVVRSAHPVHGRILQLELSDHGRALLATCRQRVHRIEAEMRRGTTPGEEEAIRRWLIRVANGGVDLAPDPEGG